jgi:RNA 3'-terminal phosphate cyclase (ATP)
MIRIDGSSGEGGGQILRSSLSLSLATGQPFRIENIRAGRERPGLLRQHLTSVLAAAEIGGATVEGAALGSRAVEFRPAKVKAGKHRFVVGTAGSATLVLQTVLPALMTADGPSSLRIEGGTHNQSAPPFDFLEKCFLPVIAKMGPRVEVSLERYGFYPAGGGAFRVDISPCERLTPIELIERGEIVRRKVTAIVANLNRKIAEREIQKVGSLLNWDEQYLEIVETRNSVGPGNIVLIELGSSAGAIELVCGFGRIDASAEQVASEAAREARAYLAGNAVAGEHLSDQLLLPFALAGSGAYTALRLNRHARTNMEVIGAFLPARFQTKQIDGATRVDLRRD